MLAGRAVRRNGGACVFGADVRRACVTLQEGLLVEKRSRRTALVLVTIAVMMVACAKLSASGALQRSGGPAVGVHNGFRFVLEEDEAAPAADDAGDADDAAAPAADDNGDNDDGDAADKEDIAGGNAIPFNPASVGWDKSAWTGTDWVTWVVPGPIITIVLSGFIFYMYGPMWAAGTFVVMCGVDALAFYANA